MVNKETYTVDFWKKFDRTNVTTEPSTFSTFCLPYMKGGQTVLDICSGNGRDSLFFKNNGLNVTSFDHEVLDLKDRIPRFGLNKTFDNVYCRFVLHCIPEYLEDYVLLNSHKVLRDGGLLCVEVRSDKGEISSGINHHYRRLINIDDLRKKLRNLNFEIVSEVESAGLSVYNNEDPVLIRFVAKKIGEIKIRGTVRDEKKTYCCINPLYSVYLLMKVKQIFDANNILFFLVFGTLLGAYRDKGFIKHDSDIDLGLLDEYRQKVMELIDEGYFAIYGFWYIREWHKKTHLVALQYKTDYIDFWFFKKMGDLYRSGRYYNILSHQIDKGFSEIEFYGEKFKTVNNIERYLKRHYLNTDWKTPMEDYHAKF